MEQYLNESGQGNDVVSIYLSGGFYFSDGTNKKICSIQSDTFTSLTNLTEVLYLNENEIATLPPNVFDNLKNLSELYLNKNYLYANALPANLFDNLQSLQTLNLAQNELKNLPANIFAKLDSLKILTLMNNNFTSLPENIFAKN